MMSVQVKWSPTSRKNDTKRIFQTQVSSNIKQQTFKEMPVNENRGLHNQICSPKTCTKMMNHHNSNLFVCVWVRVCVYIYTTEMTC